MAFPVALAAAMPSIIQGVASVANSAVSAWSQHKANQSNQQAQERANQQSMAFNREMFDKANVWNLEQWKRENDYNNPSEQMMRIKMAGLNPDLIYSGGAGQFAGSSGAAAHPTSVSLGASRSQSVYQGGIDKLGDIAMQAAQIENIKADTAQKKAGTEYTLTQTEFEKQLQSGKVELQHLSIDAAHADIDFTKANTSQVYKYMTVMDSMLSEYSAKIDHYRSLIANLDADTAYKKIQNLFAEDKCREEINVLKSQYKLNDAQARAVVVNAMAHLMGVKIQGRLADSQISLNKQSEYESAARQRNYDASTRESYARANNLDADTSLKPYRISQMVASTTHYDLQNQRLRISLPKTDNGIFFSDADFVYGVEQWNVGCSAVLAGLKCLTLGLTD